MDIVGILKESNGIIEMGLGLGFLVILVLFFTRFFQGVSYLKRIAMSAEEQTALLRQRTTSQEPHSPPLTASASPLQLD